MYSMCIEPKWHKRIHWWDVRLLSEFLPIYVICVHWKVLPFKFHLLLLVFTITFDENVTRRCIFENRLHKNIDIDLEWIKFFNSMIFYFVDWPKMLTKAKAFNQQYGRSTYVVDIVAAFHHIHVLHCRHCLRLWKLEPL